MLSATGWVPRGFASEFPEKYELDDEEMERITKLAQLEINDAKKSIEQLEESDKDDEDKEEATNGGMKEQLDFDDDLKEYDLEHYDDDEEEGEGVMASIPGLSNEVEFHEGDDENDPYISLPTQEEELEDKQEYQIYPTDNLILATRTEDDVSYLDVYVYDDGAGAPEGAQEEEGDKLDPDVANGFQRESSLYMHHDLMLPSFPLCVEWINYRPNKSGIQDETSNVGNFAAIGTFDPQIEIWNLDCVDKSFPDAILGEPSANSSQSLGSKKKKKKSKSQHVTTHHTDAVLSLSHNQFHRNVLASTSADHTIKLWDLNTATAVRSLDTIHSGKHVSSSQWHPSEGTIILTGGYDSRIAISDVRVEDSSKISRYWKVDGAQDIESVSWNTGEQFLAGTDQGNVYAFDIRNQDKPLWTLQAHDAGISSLQVNKFMPDLLVTSAMGEKQTKLWKIPTDSESKKGPSMVFSRDFGVGNVLTSSFAPNVEIAGNLVVGGVNKGLKLFDVFSNRGVRNTFRDSLRTLQKQAREEAVSQGKASRFARKYHTDANETILQVESGGEDESEDDEEIDE
jgi:periodic tryptophan protein 1